MGKIDLNSIEFIPLLDCLNTLISEIPEELIYYKYLGPSFRVRGVTLSPFRSDKNPSFGVFFENGKLIYNDFGSEDSGDIYTFVMKYYKEVKKLTSIKEMINQFRADFIDVNGEKGDWFSLQSGKALKKIRNNLNKPFNLEVKISNFNDKHLAYWKQYGITERILRAFNVFPISHYFINNKGYIADPLAFVYVENKDNKLALKIYQPYNKNFKWISNTDFSVHQGYRMLPPKGEFLIITKALKDVMAIKSLLNVPAIGVQGEKSRMKASVKDEYLSRFDIVLCLFDNDNEGRNLSEYFKTIYGIDYILIPSEYNSKDFSDLVKNEGEKAAKEILINLIHNKLKNGEKSL